MQMAESKKKASSSPNKKEKGSLLDIDIGDDFLGSWKTMSMAGDGMDFDFGTTTKGKKNDYKFDKMDMDFSLDADFGKLSSFKTDMSDLDISSPIKKSEKSKEKSKEASSGGENQAKRDDFGFSFDFNQFGDLDFGSKTKNTDEKCDNSKDKQESSTTSVSAGSGVKEVNAMDDDDTSSKNPNSKPDTQMDEYKDPSPRNEDDQLKSVQDQSPNAEEQETQTTLSSEKMISSSFGEPTQESHSSDERSSPQHMQDLDEHSLDNVSGLQEEESGTLVRMVDQSTGDNHNQNVPNKTSSSHTNLQSQKTEMCKERYDNDNDNDHLLIGNMNGDNTSKGDSHLKSSLTPGRENLAHGETADKRNADFVSKLPVSSIDSGPTTDELVSEKERGNNIPTRSKYFKIQNGSESVTQQASVSFTKLIPVGSKRPNTLPNNPAHGKREFGSKSVESSSKFSGISRPLPNMISKDITVKSKNSETGHANVRDNTRECLNADNVKHIYEPMSTTVAHSNPIRSDIHPSTSVEQSTKDLSKNIPNLGLQTTSMKSTYNMGKNVIEKNQISTTKAEIKASGAPSLGISRATEPKLKSLNSLLLKGSPSPIMRNKEQGPELQGKMVFKRNLSVDTKNQTPPPSTPTLKRKTFEASAEPPRLTPLKRLSTSPYSHNITLSSEKAIGEQMHNHADVAYKKSPTLDSCLIDIDIYSATENDALFEQAEACSKELDIICNMLKKKHEEAKDVLVRALVNNNNLLMLNHPMYQDKIHMIQKFATSLSLN